MKHLHLTTAIPARLAVICFLLSITGAIAADKGEIASGESPPGGPALGGTAPGAPSLGGTAPGGPALGGAPKRDLSVPGIGKQIRPPGPVPGPGLTKSLKIRPSTVTRLIGRNPEPLPSIEAVNEALDRYKQAYAGFHAMRQQHWRRADHCRSRSWSQQDQQAAGCRRSDTVEACERKLFDRCMQEDPVYDALRWNVFYTRFMATSDQTDRLVEDIARTVRATGAGPR